MAIHPTPNLFQVSQVRFPFLLQQALLASDWPAARTWVMDHPHLHTVALAAGLLNWAARRQALAVLPMVWAMVPQALTGHEQFWAQTSPSAMRFALRSEPLLQRWAQRRVSQR